MDPMGYIYITNWVITCYKYMIINYWRSGMILEGENLTYAPESPTGNLFRVSRTGKM